MPRQKVLKTTVELMDQSLKTPNIGLTLNIDVLVYFVTLTGEYEDSK